MQNIITGMNFANHYSYSTPCLTAVASQLDSVYFYQVNVTAGATWSDQMIFIGKAIGQITAPLVLNCYLFEQSIITVTMN